MNRILLIDDDPLSLEFMTIFLEEDGFDVLTALTEKEAIHQFEKFTPPLVITDVDLGEGSGLNILKHLRALKSEVKIIGVTGYSKAQMESTAGSELFDHILTKPVDMGQLRELIKNL